MTASAKFEPAPSAKAVRDAARADLADAFGFLTARVLRLLGFNMNFAPVLDLSGENYDNGLRARTFGINPEMVSLPGARTSTACSAARSWRRQTFPRLGGLER